MQAEYMFFVGTNAASGNAVYTLRFSPRKGLSISHILPLESAGYLCVSGCGRFLYSAQEVMECNNRPVSTVSSHRILPDGSLTSLSSRECTGRLTNHLTVDAGNSKLYASVYLDGMLNIFPVDEDGVLGEAPAVIRHSPRHMVEPLVHSSALTPDERYLCVVDKGLGLLRLYTNTSSPEPVYDLELGYGIHPRHVLFRQSWCYIITERSCELIVARYAPQSTEQLAVIQRLPLLHLIPESACYLASALRLSPSGEHLAATVRSDRPECNLLVSCQIDPGNGLLRPGASAVVPGSYPRDCVYTPDGKYLLVAAQKSDAVLLYAVDAQGHSLHETNTRISIPCPYSVAAVMPAFAGDCHAEK